MNEMLSARAIKILIFFISIKFHSFSRFSKLQHLDILRRKLRKLLLILTYVKTSEKPLLRFFPPILFGRNLSITVVKSELPFSANNTNNGKKAAHPRHTAKYASRSRDMTLIPLPKESGPGS